MLQQLAVQPVHVCVFFEVGVEETPFTEPIQQGWYWVLQDLECTPFTVPAGPYIEADQAYYTGLAQYRSARLNEIVVTDWPVQ